MKIVLPGPLCFKAASCLGLLAGLFAGDLFNNCDVTLAEDLVGLLGDFLPAELFDFNEVLGDGKVLFAVGVVLLTTGEGGTSSAIVLGVKDGRLHAGGSKGGTKSCSSNCCTIDFGGRLTMAAVNAILCCEDVKAAVQAADEKAIGSSTGFGMGGIEWELGKGAPKGGNIVPGPEVGKGN